MANLPIDIKKLLGAVSSISQQKDMSARIQLVFDPTASNKLVELVINSFVAEKSTAKITDAVLDKTVPEIRSDTDMCIVVGGDSLLLGDVIDAAKAKEVPAVVVIERGKTYFADNSQDAQSYANLTLEANKVPTASGNAEAPGVGKGLSITDIIDVDLDEGNDRPLEDLGAWIVQNVPSKRDALASEFPFLRHPLAVELAKQTVVQNGAIAAVFFMPGADGPLITLNQAKMVLQIASVYGHELDTNRAGEVILVMLTGYCYRELARFLGSCLPFLKIIIKPAVAVTGTSAIAISAIEYYEDEGKLHALMAVNDQLMEKADPVVSKGADIVGKFFGGATD